MARNNIDLGTAVSLALLISEKLGYAVIEVIEDNGSVTLKGRVASDQDRVLAEELALQEPGIVEVINNLIVIK